MFSRVETVCVTRGDLISIIIKAQPATRVDHQHDISRTKTTFLILTEM